MSVSANVSLCLKWLRKYVNASIPRVVVISYILFMVGVLLILFLILWPLATALQNRTISLVQDTLNAQADSNMIALVTQGTAAAYERIAKVQEVLLVLNQIVVSLQNEDRVALSMLPSYTYQQCCSSSRTCTQHFAYSPYTSQYDRSWLDSTSRLEVFVRIALQEDVYFSQLLSIGMHFQTWGFSRVMPVERLGPAFDLQNQSWFQEYQQSGLSPLLASVQIADNQTYTATYVLKMQLSNQTIGLMTSDLDVQALFPHMPYADAVLLMSRSGQIIDQTNGLVSSSDLNIDLRSLLADPYGYSNTTHQVTYKGVSYRLATYPLADSYNSTSNWWLVVGLLREEANLMSIQHDVETDWGMIEYMVIYPLVSALFFFLVGLLAIYCIMHRGVESAVNTLNESMKMLKKGDKGGALGALNNLGRKIRENETGRIVFGMHRLFEQFKEDIEEPEGRRLVE